ncbi:hypothetical protein ACFSLT_25370 [Novosphingobium resinovorum]
MDAWLLLLNREVNGEFNRELYLLKARGMAHSNQVREFVMSDDGISLVEPYLGENGALTGSARRFAEAQARRNEVDRRTTVTALQQKVEQRRRKAEVEIAALQADVAAEEAELLRLIQAETDFRDQAASDLAELATGRSAFRG